MKHLERLDQVQAEELCGYCAQSAGLVESTEHQEEGIRTLLFQSLGEQSRDRWSPWDIRERPGRACTLLTQTLDTVSVFLGRCSFSAHPWDYAEVGTRGILSLGETTAANKKVRILVKEAFWGCFLVVSNQLLLLILLFMFSTYHSLQMLCKTNGKLRSLNN